MESGEEQRFREIGEYYENEATRCWEITSRGHLHGGYWDEANLDQPHWHGPLRLTELMIGATAIGPDQRFVDIGSGLGLPGIMLARDKGCIVDGVTASSAQCDQAILRAAEQGLAERARFRVANALHLPFDDGTFDGGWFFESIFHMGHAAALGEARRVLKPGAELLITDFVNLPHTSEEFIQLQHELLYAHHISAEEYPGLLEGAAFGLLSLTDLTEPVIRRAASKNRESLALDREALLTIADEDYLPVVEEVAELFALNSGYVMVRARAR